MLKESYNYLGIARVVSIGVGVAGVAAAFCTENAASADTYRDGTWYLNCVLSCYGEMDSTFRYYADSTQNKRIEIDTEQ